MQLPLSRGYLAKLVQKTSAALKDPYQELLEALPGQTQLDIDETGHKDNGRLWWTWLFRAKDFALFKIEPSRGCEVLQEVLGREFEGAIGCDYYGAYRKFMGQGDARVQFCLAHLIRDVRWLSEHSHLSAPQYGERLLKALRRLFKLIHERESMEAARFENKLQRCKQQILREAKDTAFFSPIQWYRAPKP